MSSQSVCVYCVCVYDVLLIGKQIGYFLSHTHEMNEFELGSNKQTNK